MMKKSGLRDMKLRNRQVILHEVLEQGGLSRIEIAQNTRLSPSTVTGLVGELLEEGVLVETGVTVSTGGRRRIEVSVNRDYGSIAVAEIGRRGASLHIFDMLLERTASVTLSDSYISGNDLLVAITAAIFEKLGAEKVRSGRLSGIGLLFQEDMSASEFNVIYSTSLSSASITLRDALVTQFRTSVVEEYSQTYSVSDVLAGEDAPKVSKLHLALGSSVLASITLDGKPLPMRDGRMADITPLVGCLTSLPESLADSLPPMRAAPDLGEAFVKQLSGVVAMLCSIFHFDTVYLSGANERCAGLAPILHELLRLRMKPEEPPEVQFFNPVENNGATLFATKIRTDLLFA